MVRNGTKLQTQYNSLLFFGPVLVLCQKGTFEPQIFPTTPPPPRRTLAPTAPKMGCWNHTCEERSHSQSFTDGRIFNYIGIANKTDKRLYYGHSVQLNSNPVSSARARGWEYDGRNGIYDTHWRDVRRRHDIGGNYCRPLFHAIGYRLDFVVG